MHLREKVSPLLNHWLSNKRSWFLHQVAQIGRVTYVPELQAECPVWKDDYLGKLKSKIAKFLISSKPFSIFHSWIFVSICSFCSRRKESIRKSRLCSFLIRAAILYNEYFSFTWNVKHALESFNTAAGSELTVQESFKNTTEAECFHGRR